MNTFAAFDIGKLFGDSIRAGIGVNGAVFALAAVGLNLHYGFTGLLNFGMVAFMAAGAYGMAILFTQGWLGGSILMGMAAGITFAIALAMASRWRWPPENSWGYRSIVAGSRPTSPRAPATMSRRSAVVPPMPCTPSPSATI